MQSNIESGSFASRCVSSPWSFFMGNGILVPFFFQHGNEMLILETAVTMKSYGQ